MAAASSGDLRHRGATGEQRDEPPAQQSPRPPSKPTGGVCSCTDNFIPRPLRVLNIISNEGMERFSFYGVRALLVIYLTQSLHYSDSAAVALYSIFNAVCYLTPLLGALLADVYIGKVKTIVGFNLLYLCGLLTLAISAFHAGIAGVICGLFLLAVGTGGIKPNISPLGAEQIEHEHLVRDKSGRVTVLEDAAAEADPAAKERKRVRLARYFSFFYWSINIGSAVSFIVVPLIRVHASYGWAFLTCFFALLVSVAIFLVPVWFYDGYYDAPVSRNSAWARLWEVCYKCTRQRCGARHGRVVFRNAVDPLAPVAPLAGPAVQLVAPLGAANGDSVAAAGPDSSDGDLGAPGGAAAGDDETSRLLAGGAPTMRRTGSSRQAPNGAAEGDVVGAAGGFGGSKYRVSLFAPDDDHAGNTCQCVNAAVEYELQAIAETAPSASDAEDGAASPWPSPFAHKREIVLLHAPQSGASGGTPASAPYPSSTGTLRTACCDGSAVPGSGCCGGGAAAAASTPHAALLPVDVYAPTHDAELNRYRQTQGYVRDVRAVLRLLPLFAVLPIFWLIFDSQGSIWTLQRLQMDFCLGKLCTTPETLGVLNPILVIILIPVFDRWIIPALEYYGTNKDGTRNLLFPTPLRRMAAGMQIAALSFVCTGVLQSIVDERPPHSVSMFAQFPQFVLITTAEILVSITGLEFVFSQAPADMKSTVLSIYYVSISTGDLLTAVLYSSLKGVLSQLQVIYLFAGAMSAAGAIFILLAVWYKPNKSVAAPPAIAAALPADDLPPPAGKGMAAEHSG